MSIVVETFTLALDFVEALDYVGTVAWEQFLIPVFKILLIILDILLAKRMQSILTWFLSSSALNILTSAYDGAFSCFYEGAKGFNLVFWNNRRHL